MSEQNWKPGGTFFKPAPAGLSLEELAKRAERESIANHGFALVMSNGPAPGAEAITFMQKYVDGEWTLQQVLDELSKFHGLSNPEVDTSSPSGNTDFAASFVDAVDSDEEYWRERLEKQGKGFQEEAPNADIKKCDTPDLFNQSGKGRMG
jgi:hypothetical protein